MGSSFGAATQHMLRAVKGNFDAKEITWAYVPSPAAAPPSAVATAFGQHLPWGPMVNSLLA